MYDLLHGIGVLHPQEGRLSFDEFDCYHTQRPDVDFLIVGLFPNKFGGHPSWGSHKRLPIKYLLGELNRKAEVCYFDLSLHADEHIIAFEVSVELTVGVKAVEALEHFSEDVGHDVFWYFFEVVVDEVDHGASVHELDKHEQGLFVIVGKEVFGEVAAIAEVHDCDFGFDFVESAVVLEFDDAAGVVIPVFFFFVVGEEHLAHCSLTQLLLENELARRILLDEIYVLYHLLELFR